MFAECCSRHNHEEHWEPVQDCHSSHCDFDIWGPEYLNHRDNVREHRPGFSNPLPGEHRDKLHNMAFSQYADSFELAAQALAEHPEAQDDETMQYKICSEFGVFLDQCTENELNHLFNLANEFMGV